MPAIDVMGHATVLTAAMKTTVRAVNHNSNVNLMVAVFLHTLGVTAIVIAVIVVMNSTATVHRRSFSAILDDVSHHTIDVMVVATVMTAVMN